MSLPFENLYHLIPRYESQYWIQKAQNNEVVKIQY
ncbi:hypothetical protein EMIT0P253_70107 [Pseudomonas sp. IT-P253]